MTLTIARRIVANPDQHPPSRCALAWRILKTARGQTVRLSVLRGLTLVRA